MAKKKAKEINIEKQYTKMFGVENLFHGQIQYDDQSLEQPSPLKIVPSVTTYGASEDPIVGIY